MGNVPIISIVLPVRDAVGTIAAALESILRQTFTAWELVAVDDGSQDETLPRLKAAARSDARIRVLTQPAEGIAATLQTGCHATRGAFIARMDADDVMLPERLARQVEFLEEHPRIGVVSCRVRFGGNVTEQAGYAAHIEWINSLLTPEAIALRRFVEAPVAHPSVMFRRELLAQHGGYRDGDFPEDYELWLRWLDAGVRFSKVDAELLIWNDPPMRLSRVAPRYSLERFYRLKCEYLARWLKAQVMPPRELWLWGAGRITRQRFRPLETAGHPFTGFIDIDPKKFGRMRDGRPVVGPAELPDAPRAFILAGVSKRGAREMIIAELDRYGRREGKDYLLVA
ncbi:MAG: glycosyltransferase family 2 protein [Verrucomicrobia bacterium]|nr:glycosyltransferase family 2 protein [Verrucomicrobiota bacterium]